jgi:Domain of Unknown Function (DUF1543)
MRLYAVVLGGSLRPGRLGEDHETVFVVAADEAEAKRRAKARWAGVGRPHLDAIACLEVVDGYRVELVPTGDDERVASRSANDDPHDED